MRVFSGSKKLVNTSRNFCRSAAERARHRECGRTDQRYSLLQQNDHHTIPLVHVVTFYTNERDVSVGELKMLDGAAFKRENKNPNARDESMNLTRVYIFLPARIVSRSGA